MPSKELGKMLGLMLAAVVALAIGEVLLSKGMKALPGGEGAWTRQVWLVLENRWIWAGGC